MNILIFNETNSLTFVDWIPAIVGVLALVGVIITILSNANINRKTNYINIVATHRLDNLSYSKKLTCDVLYGVDLLIARVVNKEEQDVFLKSYNALYYYYKPDHIEESELLVTMDLLFTSYNNYLETRSDNNRDILEKYRNLFHILSKVFEYAYWTYVQDHSSGKKHSTKEFNEHYKEMRDRYKEQYPNIKDKGELFPKQKPIRYLVNELDNK